MHNKIFLSASGAVYFCCKKNKVTKQYTDYAIGPPTNTTREIQEVGFPLITNLLICGLATHRGLAECIRLADLHERKPTDPTFAN
jgi:hypothetical protein